MLMRSSEGVDPASDVFQPDLAPYEFDDEAMADYAAEFGWPATTSKVRPNAPSVWTACNGPSYLLQLG